MSTQEQSNNNNKSPATPASTPESKWTKLLPRAWCVDNLLTKEECDSLIQTARDAGIESMEFVGDTRHRQRVTVRLQRQDIADILWDRVKDQIPQEIVIRDEEAEEVTEENTNEETKIDDYDMSKSGLLHPKECIGKWVPSKIVSRISVAYCSGMGHLAAHRDNDHVLDEHERSFITINGYLTDRPAGSGGATRFLKDDIFVDGSSIGINDPNSLGTNHEHEEKKGEDESDVLCRVESDRAGKAVVFFHGLMHDGEPLATPESPPKWIYRTLVYYKRDPSTAPQLTSDEREARILLKEAEAAEESGQIVEAIQLYKRAYKLDPSLE